MNRNSDQHQYEGENGDANAFHGRLYHWLGVTIWYVKGIKIDKKKQKENQKVTESISYVIVLYCVR